MGFWQQLYTWFRTSVLMSSKTTYRLKGDRGSWQKAMRDGSFLRVPFTKIDLSQYPAIHAVDCEVHLHPTSGKSALELCRDYGSSMATLSEFVELFMSWSSEGIHWASPEIYWTGADGRLMYAFVMTYDGSPLFDVLPVRDGQRPSKYILLRKSKVLDCVPQLAKR